MNERIYDFVPYRYGCFSFQANQDLVSLEKNGYIAINEVDKSDKEYTLLHQYHAFQDLDMFERKIIEEICQLYGKNVTKRIDCLYISKVALYCY